MVWAVVGNLDTNFGSSLKEPWMVLGDVYLDVSNQIILLYKFSTSHINFTQNKHVELDETFFGHTKFFQGKQFKHHEGFKSKLHETLHTAFIHYNNSFKDLKT